jgi:preprotein translocase subunit YajC
MLLPPVSPDGVPELIFWIVVGSLLIIILVLIVGITCFLIIRTCNKRKERRALYLEREMQARAIELGHEVKNNDK